MWTDWLVSGFVLFGAAFALIGSIGLWRMPDTYTRLHGPTKATTLGVGGILIASAVYFSIGARSLSIHEVLVTLFLFLTAPVSAYMMARAALHCRVPSVDTTGQHPDQSPETD